MSAEPLTASSVTARYSITAVAEHTGVNPVTLRAWQRRYGLLKPQRNPQGHRLYDDHDIATIKQILHWLEKGVAIRHIKALLNGQPQAQLDGSQLDDTAKLLQALAGLDADKVDSLLSAALKEYPFTVFKQQLFLPIEEQLKDPRRPHHELQYALWQSLLIQHLSSVLSVLRRQNRKPCWVINCDAHNQTLAWLTAYEFANQGFKVNLLDTITNQLSPLSNLIKGKPRTKYIVVGDRKLHATLITELHRLPSMPLLIGSIADIHREDFC